MPFDRRDRYDRVQDYQDWQLRRRERDSWTDIAYLIVAAVALVLVARLWSRVVQPWAVGVLAQLSWPDLSPWAAVLVLALVVAVRWRITRRRRHAARGLRVVNLPRHTRATDPMASGERARRRAGSRVAEGHHGVTRSALDAARRRAHAAARVGGSKVTFGRIGTALAKSVNRLKSGKESDVGTLRASADRGCDGLPSPQEEGRTDAE